MKNRKKGSDLEEAVKLIHHAILSADPRLKGTHFLVERNKVLSVGGAHLEIDVFAQTSPNSPYESTFLFECKDWADPVGIEAVHVLASKVETLRATRGFLVARQVTKDARAFIEGNSKLRYIRCSSEFAGPLNTVTLCHSVHDPMAKTVSFRFRGVPPSEHPAQLEWEGKPCLFKNRPTNLPAALEPWFAQLVDQDAKENDAKYRQGGTHAAAVAARIEFEPGEFIFDGMDVENLEIQARFFVTFEALKPRFKFELDEQGRALSFEPIPGIIPDAAIQVSLVQRL